MTEHALPLIKKTEVDMTEKQKLEAVNFIAGWLDKASVGCLIVGLFQPDHMIGGIIGSAVCFTVAITLKVWSAK